MLSPGIPLFVGNARCPGVSRINADIQAYLIIRLNDGSDTYQPGSEAPVGRAILQFGSTSSRFIPIPGYMAPITQDRGEC